MTFNYFIGKNVKNGLNWVIVNKYKSILKFVPKGHHYILDILKHEEYKSPKYLVDVGANIGQTCLFWNKFFKDSLIYSFEPVHETYNLLKSNTDRKKNIKAFNYGLGEKEEERSISINDNSELNSLLNTTKSDLGIENTEQVEIITLDGFCRKQNIPYINLLKVDVEGFELSVLNGANELLNNNKIKFIFAEVGFVKKDKMKTNFCDFDNYITQKGFMLCGLYENFYWGKEKIFLGFSNALYVNENFK